MPVPFWLIMASHGNRCFANLAVPNNQLTLPSPNGHHGVDGFQANLHRLVNRLARNNPGAIFSMASVILVRWRPYRQSGYPASQRRGPEARAYRHLQNTTRTTTGLTFGQLLVIAQHYRAHRVTLEVQGQPKTPPSNSIISPYCTSVRPWIRIMPSVTETIVPSFVACDRDIKLLDPLLDHVADFRGVELLHDLFLYQGVSCPASLFSRPRTEPSITKSPARLRAPPSNVGSVSDVRVMLRSSLTCIVSASCCVSASLSG